MDTPQNNTRNRKDRLLILKSNRGELKEFQLSWAKHKYWVMSRSQHDYNAIRLLAKGNEWSSDKQKEYASIIERLEQVQPSEKTLHVVYEHIWGYFKKTASKSERERYKTLLNEIDISDNRMTLFLYHLAKNYNQTYLLEMRWDFL